MLSQRTIAKSRVEFSPSRGGLISFAASIAAGENDLEALPERQVRAGSDCALVTDDAEVFLEDLENIRNRCVSLYHLSTSIVESVMHACGVQSIGEIDVSMHDAVSDMLDGVYDDGSDRGTEDLEAAVASDAAEMNAVEALIEGKVDVEFICGEFIFGDWFIMDSSIQDVDSALQALFEYYPRLVGINLSNRVHDKRACGGLGPRPLQNEGTIYIYIYIYVYIYI